MAEERRPTGPVDTPHMIGTNIPAGTRVIPVLPSFWMKFLMILVFCNTLVLAAGIVLVTTTLPSITDLEFNRKIFCEQEQVNQKALSFDCKQILKLP